MTKIFLFLFALLFSINIHAQNISIGIMAGANVAFNNYDPDVNLKTADNKLGYNANAFLRIKLGKILIQPELGILNNRSGMTFMENGQLIDVTHSTGQLYGSALLGYKIGNLRLSAGPIIYGLTMQDLNNLSSNNITFEQVTSSSAVSYGAQVGLGLDINKKWSIDTRVQKAFSKSEFQLTSQSANQALSGNLGSVTLNIGYSLFSF